VSDYQTEDGQPKYGVRLNPEELAVLREKQAREAEREREAKARRLAERRAKRRAAKRDFAAAEAEYVRRAREREREREAEHEGHFEHESLAGPKGLSDHEAERGHEGQAGREGRSDHVYDRYDNIIGSYSYWSDDKDRADHEGRKSSRGEGTRAPGRSAVRDGYNVTNDDDEPAGHYRLAPGGRFVYRAVPRKKKQRGRWRLFIIGVFMMLVVPMVTLAGSVLYLTGGPGSFKAGQLLPESGQVALEAKTNYMLYSLTTRDVDSCSVSDPAGKAVAYKEGSSKFPPGSFTSTTAGTYVIKCQNTKDTKVVGPPMHIERLDSLSIVTNLGFGVAIAGVWVTIVGWRRARARGRK
jgi:UPI00006A142D related cluster